MNPGSSERYPVSFALSHTAERDAAGIYATRPKGESRIPI